MQVQIQENKYELQFEYDPEKIDFCKNLQKATYDPQRRVWSAARNIPNAIDLMKAGYFNDQEFINEHLSPAVKSYLIDDRPAPFLLNLPQLYRHQEEWSDWCASRPKALLVAEMGLGKTLMSLLWLSRHRMKSAHVLVVCPTSLIQHWVNEIQAFSNIPVHGVIGSPSYRTGILKEPGVHVVNYEYLVSQGQIRPEIAKLRKSCIILDESHKIKNPSAQRSKVLHKLCEKMSHVLLLTGTPVSQGAQDYFSQFKTINPSLLGVSYTAFKARYCVQEQIRGAPVGVKRVIGYRQLDELTRLIAPYTFTRLKKDCLDLPAKRYSTRFIELSPEQRKFYKTLQRDMVAWVQNPGEGEPVTKANILARMMALSQVTQGFVIHEDGKIHDFQDNPKLEALEEIIEELPETEPLVVVARFKHDIARIVSRLSDLKITHTIIDGDVPPADRQARVDGFQKGAYRVLVGQIQTMGLGFTMTRASKMVFYSNTYSYTDRIQAEDRIHRIGATGESCLYIDIVATDTLDEQILQALRGKQDVAGILTQMVFDFGS